MQYKRFMAAGLVFAAFFSFSGNAYGWGSLTHMSLILEAGQKEKLPVAPEYMGAFLAGSTEPDIGVMNSGAQSVNSNYFVYHDAAFVEAMKKVAETKKSPEREMLLARAMGYAAHLKGDSITHAQEGYSNAKEVYTSIKKYDKAHHLTTEFMVDTLSYAKNKKEFDKYKANYIDAETLVEVRNEYAKIKGITLESDKKQIKMDILKHRATVITDLAVAEKVMSGRPDILKQMDELCKDRFEGVNGNGGINKSIDLVAAAFKNGDIMKVEKRKSDMSLLQRTGNFASRLVQTGVNEGAELTEKSLMNFANIDIIRNNAEKLASSKLKGNEGLIGRFLINLVGDKKMALDEILYRAELPAANMSDAAIKLKMAEKELDILKNKTAAAYNEYKNRSWWKFWLYLTNSDKKNYEKLNAELTAKTAELEKLKKVTAGTNSETADVMNAQAAAKAGTEEEKTGETKTPEIKAAYDEMRAAYQNYLDAGAPESGQVFEIYKSSCDKYKEISGRK